MADSGDAPPGLEPISVPKDGTDTPSGTEGRATGENKPETTANTLPPPPPPQSGLPPPPPPHLSKSHSTAKGEFQGFHAFSVDHPSFEVRLTRFQPGVACPEAPGDKVSKGLMTCKCQANPFPQETHKAQLVPLKLITYVGWCMSLVEHGEKKSA
eukprot:gb/GECG01003086.1/.p1 GENE.gb/GECG01003086.1/~~gb/GECG01003086.1/.p1  ORF type:complete len:155 (+),score=15.45 gb/GECG01003086.1/:1-465(+)